MKSHQWQNAALRWISLAAAALLGLSLFTVGRTVLAEESTEGVFQYQITQEGAEITGYTGTDSNVTLPSQLGGYPVTGIGERAFAFNQELEEITLPDTLAYIQDSAFLLCRNLSRVNFFDPPELLQAGEGILRDTAWWEVQPEGLVLLGNTALGWKGQAPATLVLDSTVTAVADQAFSSNYLPQTGSLTRVEVGDSVQLLGAQAFAGQGSLTRIFISDSVVSLGEGLLIDCSGELVLETYIGSVSLVGQRVFVELLGRFELPTSSLPIGLDPFCIVWCFPVAFASQGLRDFFVSYLLVLFGGFSARGR